MRYVASFGFAPANIFTRSHFSPLFLSFPTVGRTNWVLTSVLNITGTLDEARNFKLFVPIPFTQLITQPKQTITQFQLTMFARSIKSGVNHRRTVKT